MCSTNTLSQTARLFKEDAFTPDREYEHIQLLREASKKDLRDGNETLESLFRHFISHHVHFRMFDIFHDLCKNETDKLDYRYLCLEALYDIVSDDGDTMYLCTFSREAFLSLDEFIDEYFMDVFQTDEERRALHKKLMRYKYILGREKMASLKRMIEDA